jgi:soluble lytic murein transglycosylase-like protein
VSEPFDQLDPSPGRSRRRLPRGVLAALLAFAVVLVGGVVVRSASKDKAPIALPRTRAPRPANQAAPPDPLTFDPAREAEYVQRAAAGEAHPLFSLSPGGVLATAARVDRFRSTIKSAARAGGVDPDVLEAIVFLESAGRPDAIAGNGDLANAAGLTQILAGTAQGLLGMRVDLAQSRKLTRQVDVALNRYDDVRKANRLLVKRRAIDERFDAAKALAATVRYLKIAKDKLGRDDLAIESYHMGIGNLQAVIGDFGDQSKPSYARLYFDSTPLRHPAAYQRLSSLGDDSATYLWRVLAARDIMRTWRDNRPALTTLAGRQTAKGSAEEALHPRQSTTVFHKHGDIEAALLAGDLVPLPGSPSALGMRLDPQIGEFAKKVGAQRGVYATARPEAVAAIKWIGATVQRISGVRTPLVLTSAVRDEQYQKHLTQTNIEATSGFSLHTSGFAFDVLRRYASKRQAVAFQFVLDRLQALDLIAWVREPAAIHVTAATDAGGLRAR